MHIEVKTQFSLFLANQPGTLAGLTGLLAKAGVSIQALTIADGVHGGILKLVVDDAEAARQAFEDEGVGALEQEVLAAVVPNQLGALAAFSSELARKHLNIEYAYGSTCASAFGCGCEECEEGDCECDECEDTPCACTLILAVSDIDAARSALLGGPRKKAAPKGKTKPAKSRKR